jgi:cell division protein FtsB
VTPGALTAIGVPQADDYLPLNLEARIRWLARQLPIDPAAAAKIRRLEGEIADLKRSNAELRMEDEQLDMKLSDLNDKLNYWRSKAERGL